MKRTALLAVAAALVWAQSALAEGFEIGGHAGWTFSDGVTTDVGVIAGNGILYDGVAPKDSFAWGLSAGFFVNDNMEVGALWDRQMSSLEITGTAALDVGDLNIDNLHGVFTYHFGERDAKARPYVLGGAGVTHYNPVSFTNGGASRQIDGRTKFSTTWGVGVKVKPSPRVGIDLGTRWTPTYIKSDDAGWWCDPYWGCYVLQNAQYSNQFAFYGGITLHF